MSERMKYLEQEIHRLKQEARQLTAQSNQNFRKARNAEKFMGVDDILETILRDIEGVKVKELDIKDHKTLNDVVEQLKKVMEKIS